VADQQVTREVARPPDPHRHTDDRRDEERPEGEPADIRTGETIQPVGGGRDRGRQRLSVAPAPAGCQARPPRRPGTIDAVRSPPLAGAVLVALLGLALYLPGLATEILRPPLEAKHALVAQEMLDGGPRLVPHFFGELFADKPPLYFWATAALGWLRGSRI